MRVRTGLEILVAERRDLLAGRCVGLITHPAAMLPDLTASVDALLAAGVRVTALFGMEHGFAGTAADGAAVGHGTDPRTGLPVFSLYGATRAPTAEMLAGVDVLVYDVQDVGSRFYTFISTLYCILRTACQRGVPVVVLDRPNPINGLAVEGPSIAPGFESFVGIAPMPIRHGMTVGELARFFNAEYRLGAELTVVAMQGWRREMWFDGTGLPWVPTSPAMPHLSTATAYPVTCLIEGTNLSEGRGTALPFEVIGAPWLDGYALADALNRLALPGVRFRPTQFEPSASKHAGSVCQGVQLHVTDRDAFRPVRTGLHLLATLRALCPAHFAWASYPRADGTAQFTIDRLTGSAVVRAALDAGTPAAEVAAGWAADEATFRAQRQPYLLYT